MKHFNYKGLPIYFSGRSIQSIDIYHWIFLRAQLKPNRQSGFRSRNQRYCNRVVELARIIVRDLV